MVSHDVNLNENVAAGGSVGSFNFLLNTPGAGFLELSYGLGPIAGFDEVGFGLGGGAWAFPEVGDFGGGSGSSASVASSGYTTWQVSGAEGGLVDAGSGDLFPSPDLALSTHAQGLEK